MIITKSKSKIEVVFHSVSEVYDYVKDTPEHNSSRARIYDSAFCSQTFSQALESLRTGIEGKNEMVIDVECILSEISEANRELLYRDVAGSILDIGAYTSGEPEHFWAFCDSKQNKAYKVYINICQGGMVNENSIRNRGAAIMAYIDLLVQTNAVEICVVSSTNKYKDVDRDVNIMYMMHAAEYSSDTLRFLLTDSSYLRRIEFAILEKIFEKPDLVNYGNAGEYLGEPGSITFGRIDRSSYSTLNKAKENIEKLIRERGCGYEDQW